MKKLFVALSVCAVFSFTGCIDREFDLAETSGEMTIGGEELVVPLGEISKIKLDDILGENEVVKPNEEGVYQISFSSFGEDPTKYESMLIDGISIPNITGLSPELEPISFSFGSLPTSLLFSAINKPFDVDFPTSIGDIMRITPIKINQPVEFSLPSQLSGQGVIDDHTLTLLNTLGLSTVSASDENEVVFDATLEILEQLEKVDWVEFGCKDHPYGAPFNLNIDFNGLVDVVAGGNLKLKVNFPEGYYLRDENGEDFPVATHNILQKDITLTAKQKGVSILLYLHKIDYSDHLFVDGKLKVDDHIKYSYDIAVSLGKGSYNLNSAPKLSINSAPEYKDVEVRINHFEVPQHEYPITHTFNGMPSGVVVEKIAFTESSKLNISLKGLEWCVVKDNITGGNISPKIEIDMPLCMHFREHPLLNKETNVLLASSTELAEGIVLSLDYIDCKDNSNVKQENGQLLINEKISAAIHMESLDGHTVLVSTITPPANWSLSMNIAESRLEVDTANSIVTWNSDKGFDFDLQDNIPYISQTIEVPEMIAGIERIEIGKANSDKPLSMNFVLKTGHSFPVRTLDIDVAVNLGKLLRPTQKMFDDGLISKNENGDYILTVKDMWNTEYPMLKTLEFDALENIPAISDGKITINQSFPVTGSAKIKSGENIDLSAVNEAKIDIDFEIDDIEVRTFVGNIDLAVKPETMYVELGEMSDLGVDINKLSLNPVLDIKLKDNPTGISFNTDIAIRTYNSNGEEVDTYTIPTIPIAGSGASNIIISTPRNEHKYKDKDVTFISVEGLAKLLSKGIPAKIAVDMTVASNKNDLYTLNLIDAKDGYNIEYQYEITLPLEFDGDIDLSYASSVMGLNETFTSLADELKTVKVGDIGLIAEFGTTIPFNIVVSAELVNAEGENEGISARLNIKDCVIKGYDAKSDGEKRISKVDLDFDLGESGSLEGLRNADGIRFKFSLYDNGQSESAALANTQYIDGKLKLRVRDGLTVDIFDFLEQQNKEE